ncbi:hypothetical protein EYR41_007003 [Orbilia oligospora]|uniref:Uncharacterized protein n=1 Tax=Orbilia oligospora TaxID=2813651 RepID=A0A8H2HSU1_ORBOL|nr:hypothetical protein EYR41_007003 [Orbilia oligospora]
MAFRKSHGPLQSSEFWKRREKITITSIALHLGCFLLWRWRSIAERYSNQGPIALKPRCLSNGVPLIQNQAITVRCYGAVRFLLVNPATSEPLQSPHFVLGLCLSLARLQTHSEQRIRTGCEQGRLLSTDPRLKLKTCCEAKLQSQNHLLKA